MGQSVSTTVTPEKTIFKKYPPNCKTEDDKSNWKMISETFYFIESNFESQLLKSLEDLREFTKSKIKKLIVCNSSVDAVIILASGYSTDLRVTKIARVYIDEYLDYGKKYGIVEYGGIYTVKRLKKIQKFIGKNTVQMGDKKAMFSYWMRVKTL
jgi:hypothetical protein